MRSDAERVGGAGARNGCRAHAATVVVAATPIARRECICIRRKLDPAQRLVELHAPMLDRS
jgi:hypothetical protein